MGSGDFWENYIMLLAKLRLKHLSSKERLRKETLLLASIDLINED